MAPSEETLNIQALQQQGVATWMLDAIADLTSSDGNLDSYLQTVGVEVPLAGTAATCRCRFLVRDANDRPQIDKLARKVAALAVDYCIPRSRVNEALAAAAADKSAEKILRLQKDARALFSHLERSGEGGELLLYLLLEAGLGIPQLLCKMPLKTNPNVHYHGVDGVHGTLTDDGRLALYWGESKLYGDLAPAIRDCFDSIAPFLLDDGSGAADRDLTLVRDHLDAGDERLTTALLEYLDDDSPRSNLREVRGACLVGFSLDEYPQPLEADGASVVDSVAEMMEDWHSKIVKRVTKNTLEGFEIEVFCVPMPSVEEFRERLREHLVLT